ncbi:NAD+ synthase [Halalkalicoccus subterraneus]|uniref:NAD+ synthase n=1 Tax=Halalkalicoccus subterraneus TaxID=2675002 RepID=UPI000EFB3F8E|nr:NAD+ synthase [Halalkalicoccus subterraneus]
MQEITNVRYSSGDDEEPFLTDPAALEGARDEIVSFVRRRVAEADAEGVVIPMSGGIDSTLTAAIAADALDTDRVLALGLPCHKTEYLGATDARTIADGLGIEHREIQLHGLLELFEEQVAPAIGSADEEILGNVVARFRMICAYYAANTRSSLVLGTSNRSELLLGYFTKYGDGGADLYPVGDLYKTEIRALAPHVGVPKRIISKEPTAGFWAGQTDAEDLGAPYDLLDAVLLRLVDREEPPQRIADELDIDVDTVEECKRRFVTSAHKRAVPPTPGLDERTR